ncbi:hypothetical protein M2132_001291 [Dysgonomonas sp. PH5-45]|uniref:C25 family cysteine peptidase n=1 Tax=unclassified Dysgonomonas TaxID=2630389 RepID=UPI00247675FE|nr:MULTISPECIES: C25 family cysteine peptidase [unclassified Dysgonomonas]MDH6354956.1 hypothetical protein [Dysgonomonas sp. PH5-45]MDH6387855.1 hypothetical protein [Dysgonomonas sp. PH5-37]
MRKVCFIFCMLFVSIAVYSQKDYTVRFNHSASGNYQLKFTVDNWKLEEVVFDGTTYQKILFSQSTVTDNKGYAELPFISSAVQLPAQKDFDLKVVSADYDDIQLGNPLLPSRGTIYRNQDPAKIPYKIAKEALVDRFFPEDVAYMEAPFIVRDVRGTSVRFYPFRWNAVTKTLRVYKNVVIELQENSNTPTNPLLRENKKPVREAIGMYKNMFINSGTSEYSLEAADHGDILVITTARDEAAIEPYIKWKKEKGFNVSKDVVEKGTNAKNLIQKRYDENNNLLYVLIVGDWPDVKSDYDSSTSGATDPMLGCVSGGDSYPDIAIGRFSSNSAEQVSVQVNKTINYEKNPNMDSGWRETFIGIGSNEFIAGDDNEKDYLHIQRIYTERLESFTYNTHKEDYDPGATAATLSEHINGGASTIAYCGHGQSTYFVTTGFNNADVNALTNGDKLPFIVAAACYTGAYHSADNCFGEAWLRKEGGGAILAWLSSISQPWAPPQRGQDYFYDLLIGGFDYDKYPDQSGINTTEQRTHFGSIAVNTLNLMLTESSLSGDWETVRTWIVFGDPSTQLRTKKPDAISYSNDVVIAGANFETVITAGGQPVRNALVCISQNGVYERGFTDSQGKVSINHSLVPGKVLLVVTAFNTTTVYDEILCVSPAGAYVLVDAAEVDDENGRLDYSDEAVKLKMTLRNVGNDKGTNVKVTISSNDPYVTITKATAVFPSVLSNDKATLGGLFEFEVDNNIPDQHEILFEAKIEDGSTHTNEFSIKTNAPSFLLSDISVNGVADNYFIENNSVASIQIKVTNLGHSEASGVRALLSAESDFVNVAIPSSINVGDISLGESKTLNFLATVAEDIPVGHIAEMKTVFFADHGISKAEPFTMQTKEYCTPEKLNCENGDKIVSFILGEIDNTDETCGEDGYNDYTHLKATLIPGTEYTAKVKCGYDNERVRGWIDYNGNGVFEESEIAFSASCGKAYTEATRTFTVPESAKPGTHRMRLRVRYLTNPTDPCQSSWADGQTHDYLVVIPEKYPRVENLATTKGDAKITVSWDAPDLGGKSLTLKGYNIARNGVQLNTSPLSGTSYEDSDGVTSGTFVYEVVTVYQEGLSVSAISDIVSMNSYQSPSGLKAAKTGETIVQLTWSAPSEQPLGYNVYRGNKLVNADLVTELNFVDEYEFADEVYCYVVTAVYANGESTPSATACVEGGSGIEETYAQYDFVVYPNPVADELRIVGDVAPQSIRIYSLGGEMVFNTRNCEKAMSIPVSALPSGIYVVEIDTANGILPKKIIKK